MATLLKRWVDSDTDHDGTRKLVEWYDGLRKTSIPFKEVRLNEVRGLSLEDVQSLYMGSLRGSLWYDSEEREDLKYNLFIVDPYIGSLASPLNPSISREEKAHLLLWNKLIAIRSEGSLEKTEKKRTGLIARIFSGSSFLDFSTKLIQSETTHQTPICGDTPVIPLYEPQYQKLVDFMRTKQTSQF